MKVRKCGPPKRRIAPTVDAMKIDTLCALIAARLAGKSTEVVLSEVAALAGVLEDATRQAVCAG